MAANADEDKTCLSFHLSVHHPMFMQSVQAATQIKQAQIGYQVGIAVTRKGLDAQKVQGEAAVQLLQAAAQLSKAPGLGQRFDAIG